MKDWTAIVFSDPHLDYSAGYKTIDGVNMRELDFRDAFAFCTQKVQELKPDFVINAGDLFERVRPSSRTTTFAINQHRIMGKVAKMVIVDAGNHCTPKTTSTGHIFSVMDEAFHFQQNVVFVHGDMRVIPISSIDVVVHVIPYVDTQEQFDQYMDSIVTVKECYNIIVAHTNVATPDCPVSGAQCVLRMDKIPDNARLTIVGHNHNQHYIYPNPGTDKLVLIPGGTERGGFDEAAPCYAYHIKYSAAMDSISIDAIPIPTRPMIDSPPIDLSTLNPAEATDSICNYIESLPSKDLLLRINIIGMRKDLHASINWGQIKSVLMGSPYYKFNIKTIDMEMIGNGTSSRVDLVSMWMEYSAGQPQEIIDMGTSMMEEDDK